MKRATKVLVLALALAGFFAMSSSSASALQWRANGSALGANETVSGSGTTEVSLTATTEPGEARPILIIKCKRLILFGTLHAGGSSSRGWIFIFRHECRVYIFGVLGICTVAEPIETVKVKGATTGNASNTFTKFRPESGEVFTQLTLAGAECPLAGEQEVFGEACAKGAGTGVESVNQSLTSSAAIEAECGTELFLGPGLEAHLEGSASVKLSGAKTGQKWGIN